MFRVFNFSISKGSYSKYRGFLVISFKSDINLKASNILMSTLNDLKEPSSANSVLLNSISNIGISLKSLFSLTASANSSMHIINR